MDKQRKIQIILLIVLLGSIGAFCYLVCSWNYAYSKGTLVTEDGTYTGEFRGKDFYGNGTFESSLGVIYKGEWKDGEMQGYGIMTFANGSKYEGEFKHGLCSGKGKMTQANGTVTEGVWENGKLIEKK